MEKNTLKIVDMRIWNTDKFLSLFIGKTVIFWIGNDAVYSNCRKLKRYSFKDFPENKKLIVFLDEFDQNVFAVDCEHGFGIKVMDNKIDCWVDKINEIESAVIRYEEGD